MQISRNFGNNMKNQRNAGTKQTIKLLAIPPFQGEIAVSPLDEGLSSAEKVQILTRPFSAELRSPFRPQSPTCDGQ